MFYRLLSHLPFPLLYGLAWLGYFVIFHVVRYRRDVVAGNLSKAFPEKSEAQRKSLARAFYRQFTQVAWRSSRHAECSLKISFSAHVY